MKSRLRITVILFVSMAVVKVGKGQTATKPSTPTSAYNIVTRMEYLADKDHQVKTTLMGMKGEKKIWSDTATSPLRKRVFIKENGRSFFELEDGEIRAYDKRGGKILNQKGNSLVVANSGNYVVFTKPGEGISRPASILILGVNIPEKHEIKIPEGSVVEAVANDGKLILVHQHASFLFRGEYFTMDVKGLKIWSKKEPVQFLGVEKKRGRILWIKDKGKMVECCDFETGKTLLEIPMRKFKTFFNAPSEWRP